MARADTKESKEMDDNVHVVLDMKGLSCPKPLIGAKRMVDELNPGQVLLLISNCPGTPDDLFSWAELTGNSVIKTDKMEGGSTGYHIQKGGKSAKHPHAHVSLDIRGAVCPGPIVEAKKLLNGMQAGEVLKMISDCPGVATDIEGWAKATGMTLLETLETSAGVHEFFIRKG
jgi:TusA-related sulfurtransferase